MQRSGIRERVLTQEVDLRANGHRFVGRDDETRATLDYRQQLNSEGSPSDSIAANYQWRPGTELAKPKAA